MRLAIRMTASQKNVSKAKTDIFGFTSACFCSLRNTLRISYQRMPPFRDSRFEFLLPIQPLSPFWFQRLFRVPPSPKSLPSISALHRSRHVSIHMASAHRRAHISSLSVEGSMPKLARMSASPFISSSSSLSEFTARANSVRRFLS